MYFVMLRHPRGFPLPLVEEINEFDERICLFDTEDEAKEAAENNMLGEAYGYEIYEW